MSAQQPTRRFENFTDQELVDLYRALEHDEKFIRQDLGLKREVEAEQVARGVSPEIDDDDDEYECMYCVNRRKAGWACSGCPYRETDPEVAALPNWPA